MARITLRGPALHGLDPRATGRQRATPATSRHDRCRATNLERERVPPRDGSRLIIRTLTPLQFEPDPPELDIEIVRHGHGHGPLSTWADAAKAGDRAAVSGTGRGYEIDPSARSFLLAGDESALPAISVLLQALLPQAAVKVLIEVTHLDARLELPAHPGATVRWYQLETGSRPGDYLVAAVTGAQLDPDARVWAACEAAAVQCIRRHFLDERGLPRSHAVVRGYWKHGRGGDLQAG
jgi:NADPH-dependent ferric siderophore reductase